MISLNVFWIFLGVGIFILGSNLLFAILKAIGINLLLLDKIVTYLRKFGYVSLILAVAIFIFGSITPYMLNSRDSALIEAYNSNITLFNGYIDEYTLAAQKQIAEYQKMQAEMARTATSTQLQFWSQQVDAVGNALSNKVKEFKDNIMKEQLDINKANARISSRLKNKWFFWVE
jgi:hypothetical protein